MKEVLKVTGLTDRAVRLYIEKELICPENEKSHTGRNNLNFSDSDVELLKKIATLRKAGFSIPQIKSIQSDSEQAQLALNELLETKEREQELNKKVIEALSPLRGRDGLDIDVISDNLENSVKEAEVPDIHYTQSSDEIAERFSFILFASIGLCVCLIPFYYIIRLWLLNFQFIKPYNEVGVSLFIVWAVALIPFILLVIVIVLHSKPRYSDERRWRRSVISCVLFIISFVSILPSGLATFVAAVEPPVCSQTTNPSNYLQLDIAIIENFQDDIHNLFPEYIPNGAMLDRDTFERFPKTTKYYYKYVNQVNPRYDIVAQWQLPEDEYEKAKEEILNKDDEIIGTETKGDWQLVHFTEDFNSNISFNYYFMIFAYNDDTNAVRYIISYCQDAADGAYQPYYYSLDW